MDQLSKKIEASPCPKCGGTSFNLFIFSNVYTCMECGWAGNHSGFGSKINSDVSDEQKRIFQKLLRLKELHDQNPWWGKTDLLLSSCEDLSIVEKYWEMRTAIPKLFR